MAGMNELMREYERARFGADRRLDVQGEGAAVARERVLRWIQSRAHEAPGQELLVIAGRGGRPGRPPSPVEAEVRKLLEELNGRLIEWWQPFAPGSLALRIASRPRMDQRGPAPDPDEGDGRTAETAGAARPAPAVDIPPELLPVIRRAAELRVEYEGLTTRVLDVMLREIWIETQALAMEQRMSFEAAADRIVVLESDRLADEL